MYVRGLLSRVIQHEVDHLDGKLIWDSHEHFKVHDTQPTSDLMDEDKL